MSRKCRKQIILSTLPIFFWIKVVPWEIKLQIKSIGMDLTDIILIPWRKDGVADKKMCQKIPTMVMYVAQNVKYWIEIPNGCFLNKKLWIKNSSVWMRFTRIFYSYWINVRSHSFLSKEVKTFFCVKNLENGDTKFSLITKKSYCSIFY